MIFCCINKNFEWINQSFDNDSENQEVLLTSNRINIKIMLTVILISSEKYIDKIIKNM